MYAKETSKLINKTEINTKTLHLVQIRSKNNEFVFIFINGLIISILIQNNLIYELTCSFAWLQPAQSRQSSQYQSASGPSTPFNPGTQLKCTLVPQPRHELRASSAPEQFLAAVPKHSLQIGSALFCNSQHNNIIV